MQICARAEKVYAAYLKFDHEANDHTTDTPKRETLRAVSLCLWQRTGDKVGTDQKTDASSRCQNCSQSEIALHSTALRTL